MTVEIRELIIRATIASGTEVCGTPEAQETEERQAIIAACVDQVLKILERSGER